MAELKIINIVGCRPNFIKLAPLVAEMKRHPQISSLVVHTGQHYDDSMSDVFFRDLELPPPHIHLNVGSASHALQTARILQSFEEVVQDVKPDLVLVLGDVNSSLACSLTAVKLGIPTAHVEAGLRSFDREMPEEINRVVTDAVCDFLFATEKSAVENLLREGTDPKKVFFTGNVMIDALHMYAGKTAGSRILERLSLQPRGYALLTLHRPANVDDPGVFEQIVGALETLQQDIPIVFPVHPRTLARLGGGGLEQRIRNMTQLLLTEPLGYVDFIRLMKDCAFVMTDSGGLQEESTGLGVPCLTLRENTERPATITEGTNRLVGRDASRIVAEATAILNGESKIERRIPEKWDGHAAKRIVEVLLNNSEKIRQLYLALREREVCRELISRV